jgi:hypothetical protein
MDESELGISPEIGRMHFALASGSRCGMQERSARMIPRLLSRPAGRALFEGDGEETMHD